MQREIPWRAKQETLEKPIEIRLKPLTPPLPLPLPLLLPTFLPQPVLFMQQPQLKIKLAPLYNTGYKFDRLSRTKANTARRDRAEQRSSALR